MRDRGSRPCTLWFIGSPPSAGRRVRFEGPSGNRADHGHHTVPHRRVPGIRSVRSERDRRTRRMEILPPAGVGEAELLGGSGDAVGGAIAGELRQKLIVLGGEAGLFLLQRRDLVTRLGGGG